jgi:hypothetical protein
MRDEFLLTDEGFGNLGWSVLHSESPLRFVETLCLMRSSWIHSRFRLFRDKESRIRVACFITVLLALPQLVSCFHQVNSIIPTMLLKHN